MATRVLPPTQMTEAELSDNVIELAHLFGWRVAHFRAARTAHGWRTPVAADGAGWPDLTMVRGGQLIFAELKSASGKLTDFQQIWLDELGKVGTAVVFRPADWASGEVERVLRRRP
jgi:hypothetical protein